MTDIFPADHLAKARRLAANELASGIYHQNPDGSFSFRPLPTLAQVSPINGFVVRDLDGDGIADIYCVGNNYGPEPSTGRFDGGVSVLLKGDGHGGFVPVPAWQSGLVAPGDTRAAIALAAPGVKGVPAIAVTECNGPVLLFTPNTHPSSKPIAAR